MTTLPLEQQVAALKYSKELRSLGYPQKGLFSWEKIIGDKYDIISTETARIKLTGYIAPTCPELGEILQECTDVYKRDGEWFCTIEEVEQFSGKTMADAMCKMLIYLIKNHYIDIKKI